MKTKDIKEVLREGWKVDKIKIKYVLNSVEETENIGRWIAFDTRISKDYPSSKLDSCQRNFTLETKEGNVYIGIGSNQPKISNDERNKTMIVEYNPQKIDLFKTIEYLEVLKKLPPHRRAIMSFDMAYDMFIDINSLKYTKRRCNELYQHIGHNTLETIYLRKWGLNGSVRIYNKVHEMNGGTNEDLDHETGEVKPIKYTGDCTRYEIRVKPEKLDKAINTLDPFLFEHLITLHKLEIKETSEDKKIIEEMKKKKDSEFKNLMMIHLGFTEKLDKNSKKKFEQMYKEIKKSISSNQQEIQHNFKNFNLENLFFNFKNFLNSITENNDMSILICELMKNNR